MEKSKVLKQIRQVKELMGEFEGNFPSVRESLNTQGMHIMSAYKCLMHYLGRITFNPQHNSFYEAGCSFMTDNGMDCAVEIYILCSTHTKLCNEIGTRILKYWMGDCSYRTVTRWLNKLPE